MRWLVLVLALSGRVAAQPPSAWVVGASGEPWAGAVERWIALDDSARAGSIQPRAIP